MSKPSLDTSSRTPTFADRLAKSAAVQTDGHLAPGYARALDGWLGTYLRTWYRPSFEGSEHLDQPRPFLAVANHSGGGIVEVFVLAWLWRRRFGQAKVIVGMAHPLVFHIPVLGSVIRGLGAIPSTYEDALSALNRGIPVLVFPGGDRDAFRPIWQPLVVDFHGRQGFLRLAAKADVPIVPIGIRGSHWAMPVLWPSRLLPWLLVLPRLLGVKRIPVTVVGAIGAVVAFLFLKPALAVPVALAWMFGPAQALFLLPVRIRVRVGTPIEPGDLSYDRVVGTIRGLVQTTHTTS